MFGVIGKYIAESGGEYILNEAHVIEKGAINSFIHGKNYKRCKRSHQLLALALEIKHFKFFLLQSGNDNDVALQQICNSGFGDEQSQDVETLLEKYDAFVKKTEAGDHGETAQFWMGYINMIKLYRIFTKSVRIGDLELFIYCLPRLADYYFALNRVNYSRWLVRYHDNLLKLEVTHPAVYKEFKKGLFSIQPTEKPFSSSPVDLTLEQTINADAACQRRGILALTNSISARQRWAQSHSIRISVISHLFESIGLTKTEDTTDELKARKITNNANDLRKLMSVIEETMNPFSPNVSKDELFNISTGKATTKEASRFLFSMSKNLDQMPGRSLSENVMKILQDLKSQLPGLNYARFKLQQNNSKFAGRMKKQPL